MSEKNDVLAQEFKTKLVSIPAPPSSFKVKDNEVFIVGRGFEITRTDTDINVRLMTDEKAFNIIKKNKKTRGPATIEEIRTGACFSQLNAHTGHFACVGTCPQTPAFNGLCEPFDSGPDYLICVCDPNVTNRP